MARTSASLRGCELKLCLCAAPAKSWRVSLLARLWIEIDEGADTEVTKASASLRGCELKCVLDKDCSSGNIVSLLARLWIEMTCWRSGRLQTKSQPPCEAVNWNMRRTTDELKAICQPPCEAVNWNKTRDGKDDKQNKSASLRGCELKYSTKTYLTFKDCQPPCEAVNWNSFTRPLQIGTECQPPCEAVNWNETAITIAVCTT